MDAKFFEIDNRMEALRTKTATFPAKILKDYRDRLDVSWIFHDKALEGVVLSFARHRPDRTAPRPGTPIRRQATVRGVAPQ